MNVNTHKRPTLSQRARLMTVGARDLALLCFDSLVAITARTRSSSEDLLIIRMDALGDFVLWLGAARALREMYSNRRIVLWCDESVCELARNAELFDEVVGVQPRKFRTHFGYRASMIRRLRAHRFGIVLHPVYSREGDFADGESLVRVACASEKISFRIPSGERGWRGRLADCWYTRLVPTPSGTVMELCRNADFVRGLGRSDFVADVSELRTEPTHHDEYFVLCPGAGLTHRRWPLSNFIEIAHRLHDQFGWRGIVCGGLAEKQIGQQLQDALPGIVTNQSGQTSLMQYISLIAGARLVVTNDTSAAHIAGATQTKSVVIVGGGEPGRFYPYRLEVSEKRVVPLAVRHPMPCDGCNWNCIHAIEEDEAFPCIAAISVDAVWTEIARQIGEPVICAEAP